MSHLPKLEADCSKFVVNTQRCGGCTKTKEGTVTRLQHNHQKSETIASTNKQEKKMTAREWMLAQRCIQRQRTGRGKEMLFQIATVQH